MALPMDIMPPCLKSRVTHIFHIWVLEFPLGIRKGDWESLIPNDLILLILQ